MDKSKLAVIAGIFASAFALAIVTPFFPFDEIIAVVIAVGLSIREFLR